MDSWPLIEVPADDEAAVAAAAQAVERITTAHEAAVRGYADLADLRGEVVAWLGNQKYTERVLVLALPAPDAPLAEAVGCLRLALPRKDDTHVVHVTPNVDPAATGRGVGAALMAQTVRRAEAAGRDTLIAWTMQGGEPAAGDPALTPPTGVGAVDPQDPGVRFALAHGFVLEQGERHSLLRLPVDPALLDALQDDAATHTGRDYVLHLWWGTPPVDAHAGLAELYRSMSTDAPTAGLDLREQDWDAERVRNLFDHGDAAGYDVVTVAAEHLPTGELAAFTQMELVRQDPELAFQGDTLVRRDHRGHRLGMGIKTALLTHLARERPGLRRVHTWNAAENSRMLEINVALGFAPESVTACWQRRLP